ncbi:MAG: peptidoglycan editing factor PgeF [Lachnospiraceae bacterium]|nr:peptidoglycan editing factor PgeF [Lachnospiraceae bacterium]
MISYKTKDDCRELVLRNKNGVSFFQYETYSKMDWIAHGFSTRLGGVSSGCFATMNLGFFKNDSRANVEENYRRFGGAVGFDWTRAVLSWQTHTTNVRRVTAADAGKGTVRDRDYCDVDGLITNVPGLALVTFYADCVPLYFVDTRNKAIGLSHSGWRGTVNRMGLATLKAMNEAYGTQPEDVTAAIGPSICGDCFEVGPEVVAEFAKEFTGEQMEKICRAGEGDRSYLDLWQTNRFVLEEAGIAPDKILITNVCTRCNPELLYSHRIMGTERGNLAAVLAIRE